MVFPSLRRTHRMAEPPNVLLNLSSRPENVLLVRQALSGVADATGLDGVTLNDIATGVTEACNNVVLHAYRGGEGPMEVEVRATPQTLTVTVSDRGCGLLDPLAAAGLGETEQEAESNGAEWRDERAETEHEQRTSSGLGLPVIRALARRVDLRAGMDGGTTVRMEFATPDIRPLETVTEEELRLPDPGPIELPAAMWVTIAPTRLAHAVLPRLLCVLAARAHFSTDRISDTELLADALVTEAPRMIGGRLGVGISVERRDLELRVGPLRIGRSGGDPTVALDGLGPVIEKLTNYRAITMIGSSPVLALRLSDER
jgi:serine/threonine-protein kinase RsbW